MSFPQEVKVGVLGATGTVGQRFIVLLSNHPFFRIHALGASSRSAGQPYGKVTKWKQIVPVPKGVRDMIVQECKSDAFKECAVIFSGLDAEVAGDIELEFRAAELAVFSNAKNHRRDPVVPLIVPLGFDLHEKSPLRVSATCTRVPVIEGHTESVSVRFARRPPPSVTQAREALEKYITEAQQLQCPSAPEQAIYVHDEVDRPQPRLDRDFQKGAGVNVGRLRECKVLDLKFVVLVNNVNLGAATSSIMNAEIAVAKKVIDV
ncbi:hypothetical protein FRC01_011842 [Tulasnella sp. 417]|nr:hypothetical protein FRC01_011842 [Tulasnella sp. 417]